MSQATSLRAYRRRHDSISLVAIGVLPHVIRSGKTMRAKGPIQSQARAISRKRDVRSHIKIGSLIQTGLDFRLTLLPQPRLTEGASGCWHVFARGRKSYQHVYEIKLFQIAIGDDMSRLSLIS